MNKIKLTSLFIITGFCLNTMYAQINDPSEKWVFGLGLNIVQDDISGVNSKVANNFSTPFILSAEYSLNNHFSFNGSLSFNKYIAGKSVDSRIVQEENEANYVAFDLITKFNFLNLNNNNYKFEPYVFGGLGYTNIGSYVALKNNDNQLLEIPAVGRLTINTGFGANYWFSKSWGMNVNLIGKFGIELKEYEYDYVSNQMQFSIGLIYSSAKLSKWRSKSIVENNEVPLVN